MLVRRPTLTSAKRRSSKSTAVPTVLTILSRHVLSQMRVLSDEVGLFHVESERVKQTQGKGGLRRLVHRPVVGVQEGDAHFIECRVIARRANEAEVREVLQSELGLIGLRYKPGIVEGTKQLHIRYIQVTLGIAEGEGEESQTQVNKCLHPSCKFSYSQQILRSPPISAYFRGQVEVKWTNMIIMNNNDVAEMY